MWSWYLGSEVLGCRTLRLESQSSAGLRIQTYPQALGHISPGPLHATGCLRAQAMVTAFPIFVRRARLGSGFTGVPPFLPSISVVCARVLGFVPLCAIPGRGLRFVRMGTSFALISPFWVRHCGGRIWVRVESLWRVCVGTISGLAPPFSAGACGPSLAMGWDVISPALAGSPACAFGCGSPPYPAITGLGLWRVVRCLPWV